MKNNADKYALANKPVKISVGCNWSRITSPAAAVSVARNKFSRFMRGAQFQKGFGKTDNGMRTAVYENGMFGTGLLTAMMAMFHSYHANVQIDFSARGEKPQRRHNFQFIWSEGELREDQVKCLDVMAGENMGIIKLPTGVGKSLCSAYQLARLGLTTLYCVPTKELMYQVANDLPKQVSGLKIGLLGDGHNPPDDSNVVIAIYSSLVRLHGKTEDQRDAFVEAMTPFDLVICDECHAVASRDVITATWSAIMDIPSYYKYGFSATPYEITDQRGGTFAELLQHSAFGEVMYELSMEEARDRGYVTPFTAYFIKPNYPAAVLTDTSTTGKTFQEAQEDVIVNNDIRNRAIVDAVGIMMDDGRKTMVVAQRIPHNDMLAIMLAEKYGEDKVYQIHGQLDMQYRKVALATFKAEKEPCVLVASSIGNTGLNIEDIECIVNATGGLSYVQNTQRTGRGLRLSDGKNNMLLIDFDDSDLGKWFSNHSTKRQGYYKDLGAEVEVLS